MRIRTDIGEHLPPQLRARVDNAQLALQTQVVKDTAKYVPMLSGSQVQRTRIQNRQIIYEGPYARYQYYGKVMVDAETGKGPMRIVDNLGNEYIRFRRGAVLKPTERDLEYTKDFHPNAGPFWFERSKADNLKTWLRVSERAANLHA